MKKQAFTLAETLITLTILGVVAAITVPSLINKQSESANRTKLKKAMTVYEKALNQMIIDNDLKTNDAIIAFGNEKDTNNKPCGSTREYFKIVEDGYDNCTFKTADRVWWNISNIENPVISLKDEIKDAATLSTMKTNAEGIEKDRTSFVMAGYLDGNGILRINDKGVASDNNAKYLGKLYGFMNPNSSSEPEDDTPFWQTDDWKNTTHYDGETNCEGGYHGNGTDRNCYLLSSDIQSEFYIIRYDNEGKGDNKISCTNDYTICRDDILFDYSGDSLVCHEKSSNDHAFFGSPALSNPVVPCPTE